MHNPEQLMTIGSGDHSGPEAHAQGFYVRDQCNAKVQACK